MQPIYCAESLITPLDPYLQAPLRQGGDELVATADLIGAADDFTTRSTGDGVAAPQSSKRAHPVEAGGEHGETVTGQVFPLGNQGMKPLLGELVAALAGSQQALRALALQAQLKIGEASFPLMQPLAQ